MVVLTLGDTILGRLVVRTKFSGAHAMARHSTTPASRPRTGARCTRHRTCHLVASCPPPRASASTEHEHLLNGGLFQPARTAPVIPSFLDPLGTNTAGVNTAGHTFQYSADISSGVHGTQHAHELLLIKRGRTFRNEIIREKRL